MDLIAIDHLLPVLVCDHKRQESKNVLTPRAILRLLSHNQIPHIRQLHLPTFLPRSPTHTRSLVSPRRRKLDQRKTSLEVIRGDRCRAVQIQSVARRPAFCRVRGVVCVCVCVSGCFWCVQGLESVDWKGVGAFYQRKEMIVWIIVAGSNPVWKGRVGWLVGAR